MKRENPYTPGVAGPPPVLAGRDEELQQFDELSNRLAEGRHIHQETILYGPRGNGKTTLLHKVTEKLETSPQIKPVFVQAPIIGTPDRLHRKLLGESPPSQQMETTRVRGNLGPLGTSVGGALETSEMTETTPEDREERCIAAMNDKPVLLMIDEAQRITGETLAAILSLTDAARRGKTKFAVIFSGTPGLPEHLKRQDATYLERAQSIRMERLDEESTRTALFQPFEEAGYKNRLNASDESRLIEQTQRYPHFIQCLLCDLGCS
ncbi:MAG: AAA family ATPase [Gammaproteobacteria bacterium]|nr:AAA family ATPase [Gammaproteobacteria bacterium]MYD81419.1 AAA family ATPase [Gammaproteobacteria bacterium]